jgi:type II secretory pathway component PulJ
VASRQRRRAAFTLLETMVAMSLFSLVTIGVIACHWAGLELNEFVRPKVENAQYTRETMSHLIEEVRAAMSIQVGTGTVSSFTAAGPTSLQMGNAVKIFTTSNNITGPYIYYYLDPNDSTLRQRPLNDTNFVVLATAITNTVPFSMENFRGTTLTNTQNNAVLSILLQLRRNSNLRNVGDSYRVRAKITRRNIL